MKIYTIKRNQKKQIRINNSGKYLIELIDCGAEAEIFGSFLAKNDDNIDVEVTIHHKAKNTQANTTLKGVGKDYSKIRFFGKIIIDKNCGSSNSFLTERILLLSSNATALAIPELEIITDDVRCSHAASISRISEKQLFYLMSRGFSKVKAQELVADGFLDY